MASPSSKEKPGYEFEEPVQELDEEIEELRKKADAEEEDVTERIEELEHRRDDILRDIVDGLTPYQRVQLARHPERPQSRDYISHTFDDFMELHGDRRFGDDRAIITGFARLEGHKLMLIAQQKGRETKEKMETNFGMPQPEGYRKALAKMKLAEKFKLPVVCLIDTPGAAPALEAEERGQGMAIAENIFTMAGLRTPIIVVITGEGCSGGALGIGVGDRHAMLQNAYYSVISPEGCAAILFRDSDKAEEAARALRITAPDMMEFGVVDEIIDEPLGGAHRDPIQTADNLQQYLSRTLQDVSEVDTETLLDHRYQRYRSLGIYENTN
ncbi:MAG: acetyl-CoA carboxylase carboxyltransferase subunit alpha [Planctomycetota bacterium]